MTCSRTGFLVRVSSAVVGLLLLVVACSPDDPVSPGEGGFLTAIAMSDTIPCPTNEYNLTLCSVLPQDSVNILKGQAQRLLDGTTGSCFAAGEAVMGALDGPVYMHHHPNNDTNAMTGFVENPSPPHTPVYLVVKPTRLSQENLDSGSTLTTLAHEGGHLLGIEHTSTPNTYGFASNCMEQLQEEVEVEEEAEGDGFGGPGEEECDDDNPCDWQPEYCMVRIWYWKDTLEVISVTVLWCY